MAKDVPLLLCRKGSDNKMGVESLHLIVHHLSPACKRPVFARSYFCSGKNRALVYGLPHRSVLFGSCSRNIKTDGIIRSCSGSFDEFRGEEIGNLARNFEVVDDGRYDYEGTAYAVLESCNVLGSNDDESREKLHRLESFLPSKIEFLEPDLLGIRPEPPEWWPERAEIARKIIELRANSVDIPLSLRMIKRKLKWQKGFAAVGNSAYCSMKRAFSSMVLMIQELQSHALSMREINLHGEDLQKVVNRVEMELNASFVWLFQQVFSRTPTLMVYVMLLLANFTVNSMVGHTGAAMITPSPRICHESIITTSQEEMDREKSNIDLDVGENNGGSGRFDRSIGGSEDGDWHFGGRSSFIRYEKKSKPFSLPGNQEMRTEEEEGALWDSIVEEASRMQVESGYVALDPETKKQFVSHVTVELEPGDYDEYYRTDLLYQMAIAKDWRNALLLSNYARFLCTVRRDYDRAEECLKRAILVRPPDAEALSLYADFLWKVRNDLWSAEERYLEALSIEPNSTELASKYASFLWSTGGQETCFPLINVSR